MTWADFYLVCFVVGFAFSVFAVLSGGMRLHIPHLPHGHGPVGGHAPTGGIRAGSGGQTRRKPRPAGLALQLRHVHGVSGLVRWNRILAAALRELLVCHWIACSPFWAACRRRHRVLLFREGAYFARRELWIPPTTTWSACWAVPRCRFAKAARAKLFIRRWTLGACVARAAKTARNREGTEVVVTRYEKGIAYVRRGTRWPTRRLFRAKQRHAHITLPLFVVRELCWEDSRRQYVSRNCQRNLDHRRDCSFWSRCSCSAS